MVCSLRTGLRGRTRELLARKNRQSKDTQPTMSVPTIYCSEPISSDGGGGEGYGAGEEHWLHVPPGHGASDPSPAQRIFPEGDHGAAIVVTIASFHDSWRCGHTIKDLFLRATNRGRVYVGVVDQTAGDSSRLGCINSYCVGAVEGKRETVSFSPILLLCRDSRPLPPRPPRLQDQALSDPTFLSRVEWDAGGGEGAGDCPFRSQLTSRSIDVASSRGPVYARAFETSFLGSSELESSALTSNGMPLRFAMAIDSHMWVGSGVGSGGMMMCGRSVRVVFQLTSPLNRLFAREWDSELIAMWRRTENENAVLSTYVHDLGMLERAGGSAMGPGSRDVPLITD